jgi:hypothetical protein
MLKQQLKVFCSCIILFMLVGCLPIYKEVYHEISPFEEIPDKDLAFQSKAGYQEDEEMIFLDVENGSINKQVLNFKVVKPIWHTKDLVFYLTGDMNANPTQGYPAYFDASTGVNKQCLRNMQTFDQIEPFNHLNNQYEVLISNGGNILIYDIEKCKIVKTLFQRDGENEYIFIFGISYNKLQNTLLFGTKRYTKYSVDKISIKALNLATNELKDIAIGVHPAWAPDGQTFAYLGIDGIYIYDIQSELTHKITHLDYCTPEYSYTASENLPLLRWSSDGEFISFHCGENENVYDFEVDANIIYSVSIDGEMTKLYHGGIFPTWLP